jgi:CheY-like chemotaxis protein
MRSSDAAKTEIIFLIGTDRVLAEKTLETVDAAAILTKPVRPSDLFNSLVAVASDSQASGVAPFYISHNMLGKKGHFDARILVAEDNPVNQDVATGILENMGCRVVTASNGVLAARLMEQESFDLVLMDCEMPEMDGFDATRCIRQIEGAKGAKRTPIVGAHRPCAGRYPQEMPGRRHGRLPDQTL